MYQIISILDTPTLILTRGDYVTTNIIITIIIMFIFTMEYI